MPNAHLGLQVKHEHKAQMLRGTKPVLKEAINCNRVARHRLLGQTTIYNITTIHSKCKFMLRGEWVISFSVHNIVIFVYKERLEKTTFLISLTR